MLALNAQTPLHLPDLHLFEDGDLSYAVDAEHPNWIAVERAGRSLIDTILEHPGITPSALAARHTEAHGLDPAKAWLHVHDFTADLVRSGMLAAEPHRPSPYPGRAALIQPDGLTELWIQINNTCNLRCTHCLVSSGPGEPIGLPAAQVRGIVDRAAALGLERLYLTGGEPFVRRDLFDLIRHATDELGLEVIVLSNGTVF
ncbi:MAG: radical SAM protein, partial [Gemmatimonadales bacterium]